MSYVGRVALVAAVALSGGVAVAGPVNGPLTGPTFYRSLGGVSVLQPRNQNRIEARYKVDLTNWDTRLEFDSSPSVGDRVGNVGGNQISFFQNQTFGFSLRHDAALGTVTWTITGRGTETTVLSELSQPAATLGFANTVAFSTNGGRSPVSLTNVRFVGHGLNFSVTPDVDTSPSGPTFRENFLHFGDGFNLLSGDWQVAGTIGFGAFAPGNPNENAKLTIKLRDAIIPTPGGLAVLALGGLALGRRRR